MQQRFTMDTQPEPMQPDPDRLRLALPMNTTLRPTTIAALVAATVLLAACATATPGDSGPSATDDPRFSMPLPSLETVRSPGEQVTGEVPDSLLAEIVAAAAQDAGVDAGEVEVITAEAVTWNDGSLGCPEPDMVYTQALVPGYRVVVEAGPATLSFHAAEDGRFVACENPQPPSGSGG